MAANEAPTTSIGLEVRRTSLLDGMILRYIGNLFNKFPEQAHVRKADGSLLVSSLVLPRSVDLGIERVDFEDGEPIMTRTQIHAERDPLRPGAVNGLTVSEVVTDDYAEIHGPVAPIVAVYPPREGMRQIYLADVALAVREAYKLVR